MTVDLDIWHASLPWHYVGQVGRSRSQEENVRKVVGATSSEGFLVDDRSDNTQGSRVILWPDLTRPMNETDRCPLVNRWRLALWSHRVYGHPASLLGGILFYSTSAFCSKAVR